MTEKTAINSKKFEVLEADTLIDNSKYIGSAINFSEIEAPQDKHLILMFDGEQIYKFVSKIFKDEDEYKLALIEKILTLDLSKAKSKYISVLDGTHKKFPTDKKKLEGIREYLVDVLKCRTVEAKNKKKAEEMQKKIKEMTDGSSERVKKDEEEQNKKIKKIMREQRRKDKIIEKKYDAICQLMKTQNDSVTFKYYNKKYVISLDNLIKEWTDVMLNHLSLPYKKRTSTKFYETARKVKDIIYTYNKLSFGKRCDKVKTAIDICNQVGNEKIKKGETASISC